MFPHPMLNLKPSVGGCCRPQHLGELSPRSLTFLLYHSIALSLFFLGSLTDRLILTPIQAQALNAVQPTVLPEQHSTPTPTVSPAAMAITADPTVSPVPQTVSALIEQYEPIKQYINTIFGRNAATAYAVAFAESGKWDKDTGRPYFVSSAVNASGIETSVGVFQINLKSAVAKVHYDRIPGQSLADKIEWLQNPYHNVLFAYWIYSTSGFHPWSVYSSGKYLAFIK